MYLAKNDPRTVEYDCFLNGNRLEYTLEAHEEERWAVICQTDTQGQRLFTPEGEDVTIRVTGKIELKKRPDDPRPLKEKLAAGALVPVPAEERLRGSTSLLREWLDGDDGEAFPNFTPPALPELPRINFLGSISSAIWDCPVPVIRRLVLSRTTPAPAPYPDAFEVTVDDYELPFTWEVTNGAWIGKQLALVLRRAAATPGEPTYACWLADPGFSVCWREIPNPEAATRGEPFSHENDWEFVVGGGAGAALINRSIGELFSRGIPS